MDTRWASDSDVGYEVLGPLLRSLTVREIMTPRSRLAACHREDTAKSVMDRNGTRFSFLPVMDADGRFLGLYDAGQWFHAEAPCEQIRFESLSEDDVIGADASIIEFVETAAERPTRLVVSGDGVTGLVSLSDLQRIPVRAAIFTLITSIEIAMGKRIEWEWSEDPSGWLKLLSDRRRRKVLERVNTAKQEDGFVSEIVCTEFSDKADIIRKRKLVPGSGRELKRLFKDIRRLRDNVSHASHYAETPEAARGVCVVVKEIRRIHRELLHGR